MDTDRINAMQRPAGMPFRIQKIGHIGLNVTDIERSTKFYTEVMGFSVTESMGENLRPGGLVFLRCNNDHHGIALFGGNKAPLEGGTLNHVAFEVGSLDEVFRARAYLKNWGITPHFEGRRRAGCQVAVEFRDPDGHELEIYWDIDQIGSEGTVRPAEEWRATSNLEDAVATAPKGQDTTLHDPSLIKA
jgi:catechol 2,3-dioxygenase-like lactoylglutathione lyase family enzyme